MVNGARSHPRYTRCMENRTPKDASRSMLVGSPRREGRCEQFKGFEAIHVSGREAQHDYRKMYFSNTVHLSMQIPTDRLASQSVLGDFTRETEFLFAKPKWWQRVRAVIQTWRASDGFHSEMKLG